MKTGRDPGAKARLKQVVCGMSPGQLDREMRNHECVTDKGAIRSCTLYKGKYKRQHAETQSQRECVERSGVKGAPECLDYWQNNLKKKSVTCPDGIAATGPIPLGSFQP